MSRLKILWRPSGGSVMLILMTTVASAAWGQMQLDMDRPPREPKICHRLLAALDERDGDRMIKAWVFFTDKGIFDDETLQKALHARAETLDPRVRTRRLKVRDRDDLVDFSDLPVHEPYVRQVLETGVRLRARSRWLNAVSVQAGEEQLRRLAEFPFVASLRQVAGGDRGEFQMLEADPGGLFMPEEFSIDYGPSYTHLNQITVPSVHRWLEENDLGEPGEGVLICLLDTGFELQHETLQHVDILAQWDFINDDGVVADEEADPLGQASHGTAVLSIIGGYHPGQLIGPAYGATYLLGKTEDIADEQPIEEDYWVEGIEWAEGMGADVVSSSLGYMDWYVYADLDGNTAVTTLAADLAASRGVVVVTAAGNEGLSQWQYIIAPADGDQVIAVGAVDTSDIRVSWSSTGPTFDGRTKPDVMACGLGTYAANPYSVDGYQRSMGTSVSTPLVAGVAALLLQADSTMTPDEVGQALRRTASRASAPDNYYGWGVVDAEAARQGITPQPLPSVTLYSFPNPFSESTTIDFPAPARSVVKVNIFTLAGELIWNGELFHDPEDQKGRCQVQWDGRNRAGVEVADGVYVYQVITRDDAMRGKLVRLRR